MALTNAQKKAIRDAVDADLQALFAELSDRQEAYFAAHGHYWHGSKTGTAPQDGADASPDKLTERLTTEKATWNEFVTLGSCKYVLQVHRYYQPELGHGWWAEVFVRLGGELWTRSRGVGWDTSHNQPWTNLGAEVAGGIKQAKKRE